MYTCMISMNIASNGASVTPQALAAVKCRYSGLEADPFEALAYHRELWRLSGFDTYQYTLSQRCFALPESDLRVWVVGGKVVEVRRVDCATPIELPQGAGTVESYFDWIEQVLRDAPGRVQAHYHGLHGYPQSFLLKNFGQELGQRQLA